jgi:hypothetical protein
LILSSSTFAHDFDHFADEFPTLNDTLEMARLSKLVYHFRHENDNYCSSYKTDDGVVCEWYFHSHILGTQVVIISNRKKQYLAVVFAGTDDIRTSLEDAHLSQKIFGNNSTISLHSQDVKVHSGFNNAVFSHGLYEELKSHLTPLQKSHPFARIFATGHSLGAANSILVATALSLTGQKVQVINFGSPKTGNIFWNDYFNGTTAPLKNRLSLWRIVIGWDLIPRLPDFFYHVGHTIQVWGKDDHDHKHHHKKTNNGTYQAEAYYQHYGEASLGLAGVGAKWNRVPHYYAPIDLMYHFMSKYVSRLEELNSKDWVDSFQKVQPITYDDDDDPYVNPPDDLYEMDI